jgi:cytoskeletal protein CcmA (bactofilin family)
MWRKTTEAKPSSQATGEPIAIPEPPRTTPPPAPPAASVPAQQAKPPVPQPSAVQPPAAPAAPAHGTFAKAPAAPDRAAASKFSSGLKIRGEVSGNADLYVDGELSGKISLVEATVTVGPNGRVNADIEAREVIIEGVVQGNLKARDRVHLGSSSRVQGSVITPRIGIDDGARLRGKVEMVRATDIRSTVAASTPVDSSALNPVHAGAKDS